MTNISTYLTVLAICAFSIQVTNACPYCKKHAAQSTKTEQINTEQSQDHMKHVDVE